jgi:hypothetical protein
MDNRLPIIVFRMLQNDGCSQIRSPCSFFKHGDTGRRECARATEPFLIHQMGN